MIKVIVFDLWNTLAYNKGKNPIVELQKELHIDKDNLSPLQESIMTKRFDDAEQATISICNYLEMKLDKKTLKKLSGIWNDPKIEVHLFDDVLSVLIFKLIVKRLGVKPDEALMIGDNLNDDVLAAESVGMKAVLLKREGSHLRSWEEKGEHEKTIKTLFELNRYLE